MSSENQIDMWKAQATVAGFDDAFQVWGSN